MFFVFREDGVEVHEANSDGLSFNPEEKIWALTDSTEKTRTPCNAFQRASQLERAWSILTTSPTEERYDRFCKECGVGVFIMECLTREEARALRLVFIATILLCLEYSHSIIHGLQTIDFLAYFDKWGPSARTCLKLAWGSWTENQLKLRAEKAAKKFVNNPSAINWGGNTVVDSHLLFTTFPIGPKRDESTLRVATSHLKDFIVKAVGKINAAKQVSFYAQVINHPTFRSAFGHVFEKFYHIWLSSDPDDPDNKLSCTALPRSVRSTRSTRSTTRQQKPKPLYLQPVGHENVIVHGGEAGKDGYKSANQHHLPFAWIPASRSDASFDAVMCTHNDIITVQATVAADHGVKATDFEGLKKNLPKEFQESRRWSHVFVTNNEDTAAKLRRKNYTVADETGISINIYTAVLDISLFQYDLEVLKRVEVPQVGATYCIFILALI